MFAGHAQGMSAHGTSVHAGSTSRLLLGVPHIKLLKLCTPPLYMGSKRHIVTRRQQPVDRIHLCSKLVASIVFLTSLLILRLEARPHLQLTISLICIFLLDALSSIPQPAQRSDAMFDNG